MWFFIFWYINHIYIYWEEVLTRPFSIDNNSNMTEAIDIKFRTHNPKYIWCRNLWKSCTVTVVYNCTCYGVWFYCFARELGGKYKQMTKICILIFFDNFMTEKTLLGLNSSILRVWTVPSALAQLLYYRPLIPANMNAHLKFIITIVLIFHHS